MAGLHSVSPFPFFSLITWLKSLISDGFYVYIFKFKQAEENIRRYLEDLKPCNGQVEYLGTLKLA